MLSRSFRLKKREIDRVRKKGKSQSGEYFYAKFLQNRAKNYRLAIVIRKKIIAKATARNRIKRKIMQIFQEKNMPSYDIVISLKNKITEEKLHDAITEIILKIK